MDLGGDEGGKTIRKYYVKKTFFFNYKNSKRKTVESGKESRS